MHLTPTQLAVLRAIDMFGPITTSGLAALPQLARLQHETIRNTIASLTKLELVTSQGERETPIAERQRITTRRARRELARHEAADETRIATPRMVDLHSNWTPPAAPLPVRPGAMRAFELPSLESGVPVPRARPISLAAGPDVRAR